MVTAIKWYWYLSNPTSMIGIHWGGLTAPFTNFLFADFTLASFRKSCHHLGRTWKKILSETPKIYHLKHLVGLLISSTAWIEYGLWPPSLSRLLELSINELPWFWDYEINMMGPTWWVVWIIVLAWLSKLINNQIICPGRKKKKKLWIILIFLGISFYYADVCNFFFLWCQINQQAYTVELEAELNQLKEENARLRKETVWDHGMDLFSPLGLLIDMGTNSHGLLLLLKQEELEEERRKKVLLCCFCFPSWYFFN